MATKIGTDNQAPSGGHLRTGPRFSDALRGLSYERPAPKVGEGRMDASGFGNSDNENALGFGGDATAERRASSRHRAVCRVGRVTRQNDVGLWRVRNISDEGMQLAADVVIEVGEQVEIALSETITLFGRIVWGSGGRCGVAFDAKIDAAAILRALGTEQAVEGYRSLRLPIAAEAIVILPDGPQPIDLVDISQQGAGYVCDTMLEPGCAIELLLPGGDQRRHALVRWAEGKRGGFWFSRPLDRADLESMARFSGVTTT